MAEKNKVKFDNKKLQKFIDALSGDLPVARVGIIGSSQPRSDGQTNAEIGLRHEFGYGVEKRSWLRDPLINVLPDQLEKQKFNWEQAIMDAVDNGTLVELIRNIGKLGEIVVVNGFNNGGYGKWAPWKDPKYMNNTGMILVDTQQLRNSISSEVVE